MSILIILRHGQSIWNLENRFTGETDVDLSPQGELEAHRAGKLLKPYKFDMVFTSILLRAIHTLKIVLNEIGEDLPIIESKQLDERNYGDLQGLNKSETEQIYGVEQVHLWRRSFEVKPPNGESLKDTFDRTVPYFKTFIEPHLKENKNILIVAHGNSLRALMMYLEDISPDAISGINLETGIPRVYQFSDNFKLLSAEYLA